MSGIASFGELVGAILSAIALARLLQSAYNRTLGRRRKAYSQLRRLGTNAQLAFFTGILEQPPAIRRTLPPVEGESADASSRYRENVYIEEDYFVQALTNEDETVVSYSVTTRSNRFHPRLKSPGVVYLGPRHPLLRKLGLKGKYRRMFDISLGRTPFATLETPHRIQAWVGARRFGYSEEHWLGNPGFYQTYLFSLTDAGLISADVSELNAAINAEPGEGPVRTWEVDSQDSRLKDLSHLKQFRKQTRINTYTVVGPGVSSASVPSVPDMDTLRTLLS